MGIKLIIKQEKINRFITDKILKLFIYNFNL